MGFYKKVLLAGVMFSFLSVYASDYGNKCDGEIRPSSPVDNVYTNRLPGLLAQKQTWLPDVATVVEYAGAGFSTAVRAGSTGAGYVRDAAVPVLGAVASGAETAVKYAGSGLNTVVSASATGARYVGSATSAIVSAGVTGVGVVGSAAVPVIKNACQKVTLSGLFELGLELVVVDKVCKTPEDVARFYENKAQTYDADKLSKKNERK